MQKVVCKENSLNMSESEFPSIFLQTVTLSVICFYEQLFMKLYLVRLDLQG